PMEGRGGVADWSAAEGKLTLWSGTQVPHLARHGLAEVLGLPEHRIRVVAPDVGGGFGVKGILYPEDVALCLLAMRLERPVRWIEQRREHFLACAHARDHRYTIRAGFDADGRLRSLDARALCNTGAYSVFPWTAGIEPLMVGGLLTGPYKLEHYRCEGSEGRYVGIGFANYNELTGLGRAASAGPRMPFRTGHEGATVRMDPSGAVTVLAGVTSQGQSTETTLAQVAAADLGVPFSSVSVVLGDTDATPFGLGAF